MGAPPSSPATGRRERTKARNRAMLLAAAREVFAVLGYDAASVRDIVRRTDLSVGTFYQYFRDKDQVFTAVADEAQAGLRTRLRAVRRDRTRGFEERIEGAYRAFFEFVVEERALFEVLERTLWSPAPERAEAALGAAIGELRDDLGPDAAAGALGGEDPGYVASAMIGAGLLVARRMLAAGDLDPARAARFCTRFSLAGLGRHGRTA